MNTNLAYVYNCGVERASGKVEHTYSYGQSHAEAIREAIAFVRKQGPANGLATERVKLRFEFVGTSTASGEVCSCGGGGDTFTKRITLRKQQNTKQETE